MNKVYLFDGTLGSYSNSLKKLWYVAQKGERLCSKEEYHPGLFETVLDLDDLNELEFSQKETALFKDCCRTLIYSFCSGEKEAVEATPSFISYMRTNGNKGFYHLAEPSVRIVTKAAKRTSGEAHKLKGILRFRKFGNLFYGQYFSKTFVLPMLGNHFFKRMPNEKWIIHDTERETGLFYDGKELRQAFFDKNELAELKIQSEKAKAEDQIEKLWKKYFNTIAIETRKNPKLQQSFMPKQYWRYIVEVEERVG
jgi:probable DNA metabolism protein